jgi:hypothetical protein
VERKRETVTDLYKQLAITPDCIFPAAHQTLMCFELNVSQRSTAPLNWINYGSKPSEYAENLDNWIFL